MPDKNPDLHGMVPDKSATVLLLLDVINDLDFPEGEQILEFALPMAHKLADLKRRARELDIPAVYVNDNYGRWQSDFNKLIERCLQEDARGKPIVELLRPEEDDYFVLKPKHSGFFSTTLDVLLDYLKARTVIITGIAGNICVLFTANDAYMRDFQVVVPSDCVASNTREDNEHALKQMQTILKADITPSTELDLKKLAEQAARPQETPNPEGESRQFAAQAEPR